MRRIMRNAVLATAMVAALMVNALGAQEKTHKPDAEGFVRNWLVLAPLPYGEAANGTEALDKEQVKDEAKLKPKEGDTVEVIDTDYTWKKYEARTYQLDINAFLKRDVDDRVAYAVCYLVADAELNDLVLKIGSDDQAKVYLNGKEVLRNATARMLSKDQDSAENITLKRGVNVVVFKIVNEKLGWYGCLRFTDKDGKPITNLKIQLKP
jgi:hypothetical protein